MRSRLRSLLIVVGIALGVGLYVATEAATDSMIAAFDDLVDRISGRADLSIEGAAVGVPFDLVSTVANMPGVAHAAPVLEVTAQAPELGESLLVLGVDLLGDRHFLPFTEQDDDHPVVDDPIAFINDPLALLVSSRLAKRHQLKLDSPVKLLTAQGLKQFHVRGIVEDSGAAASFGGQVVLMFLDAAQVSFGRGTSVDRIDVALDDRSQLRPMRDAIRARVGDEYSVQEPEQIGMRLRALAAPLELGLAITGFLAIIVGSFLVYNAIAISVAQRRREVAILRALGETRSGVVWLFMLEAAMLALPGSAIGLALGSYLAQFSVKSTLTTLDSLYMSASQIAPELRPDLAVRALLAGIMIAFMSAYMPARRGTAFDPAIALRGASSVELKQPPVRLMLLGALVLGVLSSVPWFAGTAVGGFVQLTLIVMSAALATPAFVIGMRAVFVRGVEYALGVPGRLGLDYVARSLSRSTVNVLALMVAVSMSVSVSSWLASFERSLGRWAEQVGTADLTVTRGSPVINLRHVPLLPEAVERVGAVPGVGALQRFRMLNQEIGATTLRLVATDTDVFLTETRKRDRGWELTAGAPLRRGDLSSRPSIALSENAARQLGVALGDTIELSSPSKGRFSVAVRAVVVDFTSQHGTGFIDLSLFHEYFQDDAVDGLFVYVAKGYSPDAVADQIRATLASGERDASIFVTKTSAVQKHLVDTLDKAFSYSRAVELLTLVIGLLGVIGTMVAAVLDRQQELSMLRAVGATRAQVALSIVVEAGFLGLCAATAGIAVGVIETQVFFKTLVTTQTGWHLAFVFPWTMALRTTLLVVGTSALAGAIPAYRAVSREQLTAHMAD